MKMAAAAVLAAVSSSTALAGGFMLTEQSVAGLGRAYAGAGIVGDDLSAVWYNPAGMTLLPGTQFQMGGVFVDLDLPVKTTNGAYSDNGRKYVVPIPSMFFTHQMNEDMWFGVGLTVPYGMATEYQRNSEFNTWGMNSEIKVFDLNPNLAWKVSERFSIGAGMSLQYATAHFEKAQLMTPKGSPIEVKGYGRLAADSLAWGGNIGVMWSPIDSLRFGLAYRSAVNHHAKGSYRVGVCSKQLNQECKGYSRGTYDDASASLTAPHTITLTGTWEATEDLRLSALVRWADWSSFKSLKINYGTNSSEVPNNWDDSWLFTVGADYRINGFWTVRGGLGYEISPVQDKYRTAVIPDGDRLWFSLGATWRVNERLTGDFGLTWLHGIKDKGLYDDAGDKVGEYDKLEAFLIGAQFQYKF